MENLLRELIEHVLSHNHLLRKVMSQLDDLTAAVATLQTDITTLTTNFGTEVTALQAQIAALQSANPAVDLTGVTSSVNSLDAMVKAATPAAPAA